MSTIPEWLTDRATRQQWRWGAPGLLLAGIGLWFAGGAAGVGLGLAIAGLFAILPPLYVFALGHVGLLLVRPDLPAVGPLVLVEGGLFWLVIADFDRPDPLQGIAVEAVAFAAIGGATLLALSWDIPLSLTAVGLLGGLLVLFLGSYEIDRRWYSGVVADE